MRIWLAVLLVSFAGCIDGDKADKETDDPSGFVPVATPPRSDGSAAPPVPTYGLWELQLCDQGFRTLQRAMEVRYDAGKACDFRVTKPLLDGDLFDWQTQHGPGNEVSMAVNPTDPLNLIGGAKDYTVSYISDAADCGQYTVWNGHFASLDAGRTWTNDLIPGFPGDPRPSPLHGNLCNTDPVSVFDADGTYWHNGLNYRGARDDFGDPMNPAGNGGLYTGSQIFFARSDDKGASFSDIFFASYGQNDPGIFNDKNWLAVDPNSDHMIHTWTNFYGAAGVIEFVESFDNGATWTHPTPLTPGAGTTPTGQFSMPVYDSSGNIWVIWSSGGGPVITHAERPAGTTPSVFLPTERTVSYSGGLGGSGCLAETNFRASTYPVLGIDVSGGDYNDRKYIAWPSVGDNGTGVWVTRSDDGSTWNAPVEVTAGLPDDQFMSWIDVGPDGTVHVAYYDCSVDATGSNMTMGYTYSSDGGDTWEGPFWVGQVPFNGDLGHHQSGVPFIGDYNAVDASDKGVSFFWADTRTGRSDVYAATIVKAPEDACMYAPELIGTSVPGLSCTA